MFSSPSVMPISFILLAALLVGCQRAEPPPTVIVAPGPAGEPGAVGATGATGDAGKPGTNTTVIVTTPPASAASV